MQSPDTSLEAELTMLEEVQATVGPVGDATRTKARPTLDRITRRFIELSPFLCIGSGDAAGGFDVSPRGDPPGFVKVLDDRTLVIPERTAAAIEEVARRGYGEDLYNDVAGDL